MISDHEKLDWSTKGLVDRALLRPWKIMASEPILIVVTIYMSVVYGLLYACKCFFLSSPYPSSRSLTCRGLQYSKPSQSYSSKNEDSPHLNKVSYSSDSGLEVS